MTRIIFVLLAATLVAAAAAEPLAAPVRPSDPNLVWLPAAGGVDSETLQDALRGAHARGRGRDAVVLFMDHRGEPIFPDLAAAANQIGGSSNQIRFTFDSPSEPWSSADLDSLRLWARDYYALAVGMYGPPAFDITVNVRKASRSGFEGYYAASINEMGLFMARADVFVHEMLHAFHDDAIYGVSAYVEGVTRAAEVAILDSLGYITFSPHHYYPYFDVHYDMLNKPALSAPEGNIGGASSRMLLRYQLGGYAWEKPYLENRAFFANFNARYYSDLAANPGTRWDPVAILAAAASAAPTVEGEPFAAWSARQHILNARPPHTETFLYQDFIDDEPGRVSTRIDLFKRVGSTELAAYEGAWVEWQALGFDGTMLSQGEERTNDQGTVECLFTPATGYAGRVVIVATAHTPDGVANDTTFRSVGRTDGLFGVVRDALDGLVTVTRIGGVESASTWLTNGCFDFPALAGVAGTFRIAFTYPDGRIDTRTVTKDASRYYVQLGFGAAEPLNLVRNPSFDDATITGWSRYGDSAFRRTYPGRGGIGGCLYVTAPGSIREYGVNDHPNWVTSVPQAGTLYRFTAWVRGTYSAGKARMRVREYTASGTRIGGSNYSNSVPTRSYFQKLTLDYAAHAAGTSLDLQILAEPTATGSWIMVDDVSIQVIGRTAPAERAAFEDEANAAGAGLTASLTPQPLSERAVLSFTTAHPGPVRLAVYDLAGRRVRTVVNLDFAPAGEHHIAIERGEDNTALRAGVYFWRLLAGERTLTGRLVVSD